MARNRQRAKERQARRKAGAGEQPPATPTEGSGNGEPAAEPDLTPGPELTPDEVRLRTGAPPEDVGRSDEVLEYEQDLDEDDEEHFDPDEDQPEDDPALVSGPRGRRGGDPAEHKNRPRFVQFLFACWAELQRVQWPDRQTLTTLTGVVLGFVLIAGGYLGLLDAIVSRIIQAIL
jgi:preprotein translocase subunit SecE